MIYVSSACIRNDYIVDTIEQYAKAGIKNIELSGGTKYYDNIEADLKCLKEEYGLRYVCHAYFPPHKEDIVINLASCNDKLYKASIGHYEECIDFLNRMDIDSLSIHAGFLIEIPPKAIGKRISDYIVYPENEAYDRFVRAYNYIARLCNEANISLYLENNVLSQENYISFGNNNYFMMTDYISISKMQKLLDFSLLLDMGHLNVSANSLGLSFEEECKKLSGYVKWIHISDNNGIIDQHKPILASSEIYKQYRMTFDKNINLTLETNGSIEDIKNSLCLAEEKV